MSPVVSILLASIGTWFRSRVSMQIEIVALRHQVAVYKQTVSRPHCTSQPLAKPVRGTSHWQSQA